jgi:hypothetical protein
MSEIPHQVLSEHFQERMQNRRLRSAVFLSFQFDAGFFEQEVLPVLLDIPVSHASEIRLVQLEDALRDLPGQIAVYYDANGLVVGDAGSARLDFRRIPVQHRTGIFHPKNVFLLVEDEEPDEFGSRAQTLIVASMSANLTRAGWWENVECCHVEEVEEGDRTRLRDDLVAFLVSLRRKSVAETEHAAIREILGFLRRVEQRHQKSSEGKLHTHFYSGAIPFLDFLETTAGEFLHDAYLEVLSPYFDDAEHCKPLEDLIERFSPKEVRVFLPRAASGEALVRQELYESVKALSGVYWGRLSRELTRLGRSEDAGERMVHAKVYRFFTLNPKREICFVGSSNLTSSAHRSGGNLETGFLVDVELLRRPEFWLAPDKSRPTEFSVTTEDDSIAASGGTRLNLRYHWDTSVAELFWDSPIKSPKLRVEARGIEVGSFEGIESRVWTEVNSVIARQIESLLRETSLFLVYGENDNPGLLLVQEEGMSHKPSLLLRLSAADILRYWALLTSAQRAAFLEARAPELSLTGPGADLVTRAKIALKNDTVFDRFAGFFHAFSCLERSVREALAESKDKEANYRLFGKKYDSLGSLLDRVLSDNEKLDTVDCYLIVMCARQMCQELGRSFPEYWRRRSDDVRVLQKRIDGLDGIRDSLIEQNGDDFREFLEWFDRWFLNRAEPVEVDS